MGMFFRNLLDEGFYTENDYGTMERITDMNEIIELKNDSKLYKYDGYSLSKINKEDDLIL